ncbi:GntR family transcriptional regulator [Okibacterium endophyticum]
MTSTISASTKSVFAYDVVRSRILRHEYLPGQPLNQAALAQELGISTTPLREALRRLESEDLVELRSHSDARVTELTAEGARDLLELRLALDPLAVALAADRRTKADIARMRAAQAGMTALPNTPSLAQLVAHREFHRSLYSASHNEALIRTLDGLWDKADRYRIVGLEVKRDQEERDMRTREHHSLLDLVIAGDAEGAADVMRTHITVSLGAKAARRLGAGTRAETSP